MSLPDSDPADGIPPEEMPPAAVAVQWVSRITTVALEMVLPGLLGMWADNRWGTSYLVLLGFGFGVTLGIWHLIKMTAVPVKKPRPKDSK